MKPLSPWGGTVPPHVEAVERLQGTAVMTDFHNQPGIARGLCSQLRRLVGSLSRPTAARLATWCVLAGLSLPVASADTATAIKAIQQVSAEGKGATAAVAAYQELAGGSGESVPALLTALDTANPLAANYLRNAIEVVVDRALDGKQPLPEKAIEAFLADRRHDSRARRLAFEILVDINEKNRDRLVPGFLDDPSVELRRDAVAQVLGQAETLLKAEKKDEAKSLFGKAMTAARDDDQVQLCRKQLGELGVTVDLPRHFGFLMNWKLIAPFDNTDKKGFAVAYPPEKELDFTREYASKEAGVMARWTDGATEDEYGIVDVAKLLMPWKGAVAYAAAEFDSPAERAIDIRLGTPNSWKVWLNGELLFAREEYHRGMSLDQYRMRGQLKAGKNTILIKLCQNEQTEEWAQRWQFQLRVCDATGTAVLSADRKPAPAATGSD